MRMQKKLDVIFSTVVLLLGAFHTSATLFFQRPADLEFLMFVGSGLGFLLVGSINLPAIKSSSRQTLFLALIMNLIYLVFMIFIVIEVSDFRAISVIIAMLYLLISSMIDVKKLV